MKESPPILPTPSPFLLVLDSIEQEVFFRRDREEREFG